MPKRARVNNRVKRQKDKIRKRQCRQHQEQPTEFTPRTESVVPCGSIDGTFSAPPGSLPRFGSMGFPPKEENPWPGCRPRPE